MRRKFIILIIVIFPVLMIAQPQVQNKVPEDEEDVYFILSGEADKAISSGDYPTAIARINDALMIAPDNPTNVLLLSNLGILYNYLDQDSLALDAFDRANLIAPSMTIVLVNRGKLHLKMGNDADAFEDFDKVVERDSTNTDALFYHGIMALYGGKLSVAEHDFKCLEAVAPDTKNTAVALSTMYSMTGREAQAIPYLQRLVEIDPQPEYFSNLAGCYLVLDRLSEASALLNEAVRKYPDDPEVYLYRAWLNKKRYLIKEAREDADTAISLGVDPRNVERLLKE